MEVLDAVSKVVETSPEKVNWHAREVTYIKGSWDSVQNYIPEFKVAPFEAKDGTVANPFLRQIVRIPLNKFESEIPVGVVSPKYTLAQHKTIAKSCIDALKLNNFNTDKLTCELGLSELGEWMNFRVIFPDSYEIDPGDGHKVGLRLECFNSVDGSSRLQVRITWNRLVCLNGISAGETKNISNVHNKYMDLSDIKKAINNIIQDIDRQKELFRKWTTVEINSGVFEDWIDDLITKAWGVKAACRIYNICISGWDVKLKEFESGRATEKTVYKDREVPGAPSEAKTYYDVAQAMAWVATQRNDAEVRSKWQADISKLMSELETYAYYPEEQK